MYYVHYDKCASHWVCRPCDYCAPVPLRFRGKLCNRPSIRGWTFSKARSCLTSAGDKRMDEWVSGLKLRSPPTVPALVPQLSGLLSVGSLDSCALFATFVAARPVIDAWYALNQQWHDMAGKHSSWSMARR